MDGILTLNLPDDPFRLFSPSHTAALILIAGSCVFLAVFRRGLRSGVANRVFRYGLAAALLLEEAAAQAWLFRAGEWSVAYSLPLHLCSISALLSAVMLVNKSYSLYELTYFWGLGGAVQALLTPDLGPYSFPHLLFYQFFLSHGAIVAACIFMTFVENYRPTHKSIWKTFTVTNLYALPVAAMNHLTGGNYLYMCEKPYNPSLLDYLGPWPWYLLSLELVLVATCYAYFAPFALYDRILARRQKTRGLAG